MKEKAVKKGKKDKALPGSIVGFLLGCLVACGPAPAGLAAAGSPDASGVGLLPVTDVAASPMDKVQPIGLNSAHWTDGFWKERFELCRTQMIPSMERLMEGTNYSQFFRNFEIVAGDESGKSRGATFNDGDFYKFIEAASAMEAATRDPVLKSNLDRMIAVMGRAQQRDGYLDTWVQLHQRRGDTNAIPFSNPENFEMYNAGQLMTAACINYRSTGETNLLAIACRVADHLAAVFANPTPRLAENLICPSHYMGLVELYRTTHDPRYLNLARQFLAMRDLVQDGTADNQDQMPLDKQTEAEGHAVRANYLYAGMSDLYLETGDEGLWQVVERMWTNVVECKMYITGGCGALYDGAAPDGGRDQKKITRIHQAYGRDFQLPNITAHNETCANIGNALWNWRMFLATGEARHMDVVELELYNSVLSGVSLDGTNFFYTNPLRVTDPLPTTLRWPRTRVPFLSSFCCPPNLLRTISESAAYAYGMTPGMVWVNLYGGSAVSLMLPDGNHVCLVQQTDYPWNGRVRIIIQECGKDPFALNLRIPGWAKGASVRVNDGPPDASPASGTYHAVRRMWHPGDFLDLDIPMPVRMIQANPLVEEDINQVAFQRGPVVYCLESPDLPSKIRVQNVLVPPDISLAARYDRQLLDGVVVLEGKALAQNQLNWSGTLYRDFQGNNLESMNLRLIPYSVWQNRGPSEMSVWLPLAAR